MYVASGFSRTFLDTIDLRDVWVVQCRQRPRFALESREPLLVACEPVREDLDGDLAPRRVPAESVMDCGVEPGRADCKRKSRVVSFR
jgi:hypothetical protein